MKSDTSDEPMWLVYIDVKGKRHFQHWNDVVYAGSLIDPETGEDMEIIGWCIEKGCKP